MKKIRLTEEQLHRLVVESVNGILEDYMGNYSQARMDFDTFGFSEKLRQQFPDMDFECYCDESGGVTVKDLSNGNIYYGDAETSTDMYGTGRPSVTDRDTEETALGETFDFSKAYRTIVKKIKANMPDEQDEYVEPELQ